MAPEDTPPNKTAPKKTPRNKVAAAVKSPCLSIALQKRVSELNATEGLDLNSRRLAKEMNYAYDPIRKVVKGTAFPGKQMLKDLCDYLDLNLEEMSALLHLDRAVEKGYMKLLLQEDPIITKIKQFWPHLNKKHRQEVLADVEAKARQHTTDD